jgi:hypothetical protein
MSEPTTEQIGDAGRQLCSSDLLAAGRVQWKVHTYGLLKEISDCSGNAIYQIPLNIFGKLLAAVGERAIELNDPKLNALMCRLTIYSVADPESPDYDPDTARAVMQAANEKAQ